MASFGGSVKLTGESEYQKALKGITDNLTVLSSEMKVVSSSFGKGEDSISSLSQKNDILNKKLSEQNKALDEAKKMLDEAKNSTEANETTILKWQNAVNKAQAEVNKTTKELKDNEDTMDKLKEANVETTKELKNFEEQEKKAGDGSIKLGDLIKANLISDAIKSGINALANGISNIASAMGSALTEGASYADNILTLSTQTGIATDKLQKYQAISELTDVSLETVTKSMAKMVKGLETNSDNYEKLGVSVYDANGNLRDSEDIFNETLGALGEMANETERDALAMELFGKSAQELNPLIEMGTEGLNEMTNSAEQMCMVLSEEGLNALGELDDQMQIFKSTTGATGNILASAFAPNISTIIGGVNDLGIGFNYLLSSLVGGDSGGIETATGMITESIGNMVTILQDNITEIMNMVDVIFPTILQILTDNLPTIVEGGISILTSLLNGITNALPNILPVVIQAVMTITQGIINNLPTILQAGITILVELVKGIAQSLPEIIPAMIDAVLLMVETLIDNIDLIIDAGIQLILGLADGLIEALPRLIDKIPVIIEKLINAIVNNLPKIIEAGITLTIKLAEGLIKAIPQLISKLPQIITSIVTGLLSGVGQLANVGKNLLQGLWEGMKNLGSWLWEKVKGLLGGLTDKIKNFFGIHSPSTLFKDEIGTNLALGIGEGFEDTMSDVNKEMASAVQTDYDLNVNSNLSNSGSISTYDTMVSAFKKALEDVKVVMNDREMGTFVTDTMERVVYN